MTAMADDDDDLVDPDDIEAAVALGDAYASELNRLWRRYYRATVGAAFVLVSTMAATFGFLVSAQANDTGRTFWCGAWAVVSYLLLCITVSAAEERRHQWKELFSWSDSSEQ